MSNPAPTFPLEFSSWHMPYSHLVLLSSSGILLLFLSRILINPWKRTAFKNENGEAIKELKQDTRAMRFSHGKELSQAGKAVAGNDPYLIRNGNFKELVIFAPNHLQEFLRQDSKDHIKAKNFNMGDYAGRILGQCVGQQHGKKWRTMRSYFDPEFSHQSSLRMLLRFSKTINEWAGRLASASDAPPQLSKTTFTTDVVKACKMLAFHLIAMSIYGEAFDQKRFQELVELSKLHGEILVTAIFKPRTMSKLYNLLPTAEKKILDNFLDQWAAFNSVVIKDARERNISCPAEVIFQGVDRDDITQIEFLQTLDEMLFTNIDITGSILAFILINLGRNVPFQETLRAEIVEKGQKGYNVAEYISKQDTLLHYVTLESIRVTPAMWFSPPECTAIPKIIGGYQIPGGTPVIIDVRRLNTNATVWGDDGESFRPERFIDMNPSQYRYGLLRWGIGPGKCMGKNMADLILKLVTLSVLEQYCLRHGKEREVSKEHYTINVDGEIEFTRI